MKIKEIILTNFRIYKGTNVLSFEESKDGRNMYLIAGENGFGKTTFLQSLLWCLYGKLMTDIDDSLKKDILSNGGYQQFLIRNLNNEARKYIDEQPQEILSVIKKKGYSLLDDKIKHNAIYSVSICFYDVNIPSIPCREIKIVRSFDYIKGKEDIEIYIDGQVNELTNSIGNEVFINDFVLNKDVARFFFFDSERIVALADVNSADDKRSLASAYNEVLGVKKYEDLKHTLESLRLKFRRRSSDIVNREKLNKLLQQKESLSKHIAELKEELKSSEETIITLKRQNNELQERLLREGQTITLDDYHRLSAVLTNAKRKDDELKQQLKVFLDYAPFAILGKLFEQTKERITREYNLTRASQNIVNQNQLLDSIYADLLQQLVPFVAENSSAKLRNRLQKVIDTYREEDIKETSALNITKDIFDEFMSLYGHLTTTYKVEFAHAAEDYKKNKQIISRNTQKLSNMQSNEKDVVIQQIRQEKNRVEQQLAKLEDTIKSTYATIGSKEQELTSLNKQISSLSKIVSIDDSDEKKDQLSETLISELDAFLVELKQDKKQSLECRLKTILNSLMHKEDFISRINVALVDDGMDIELYNNANHIIPKQSLSKGEQQLYATALLKAFVEESGIQFPVFIDSPLQKFDKSHSQKIITEFYPNVSKQVILFPLLHKELTEIELDMMMSLINASYMIRNRDNHSYFEKVDTNNLMSI